jgi:predicted metal-dependent peptidase
VKAEARIHASVIHLRTHSPFFATLALYARFQSAADDIATAATNGQDIFYNPEFIEKLNTAQVHGLLLHEVLHAALLHVSRRRERDPLLWNVAADIVVNGIIVQFNNDLQSSYKGNVPPTPFALPLGALREPEIEHLGVEEIYELLLKDADQYQDFAALDLVADSDALSEERRKTLETYWQEAQQRAIAVQRTSGRGGLPLGLEREFECLRAAQLDWRSYLWRYLVQTPSDFVGFDRRFVGRGLYLESLEGELVDIYIAIDTSGSIQPEHLQIFLSEVQGILSAYPHLRCQLFYADAEVYGPFDLENNRSLPKPVGGGGTSFVPFFTKIAALHDPFRTGVCVYLTDGFGQFPAELPALSVLWVSPSGGLALERFPFGEAVRLLQS